MEKLRVTHGQASVQTMSCPQHLTTHHIFHEVLKPPTPAPFPKSQVCPCSTFSLPMSLLGIISCHPEAPFIDTKVLSGN